MTYTISSDFTAWLARDRQARAARLSAERYLLLRRLRMAGVRTLFGSYDGYGDSGNYEEISLDNGRVIPSGDLVETLGDFVWDVAYFHHSGFENNEGGYGELTWDIEADSITLDHADRFIETHQTLHEGI